MKKKNFYDISSILKEHAEYNILLGQRSNGKSYQCKKLVLDEAWKKGLNFVYLRRMSKDVKPSMVEQYFGDIVANGYITELTDGEWDGIACRNSYICFSKLDEDNKLVRSKPIGQYWDLRTAEHAKSMSFVNMGTILYEEFLTDGIYLDNEPARLMQFVSTVARLNKIRVLLVGNTLTRICPYFDAWALDGVMKQKIGTIETYEFKTDDGCVKLAVERCATSNFKNHMFFGKAAEQIVKGEWDTHAVPVIPAPPNSYERVYPVLLEFNKFKFVMELLIDGITGGRFVYVYPYHGKRKIDRIITQEFSDKPFTTNQFLPRIPAESLMIECFRLDKVCYSDNLTGTDFENVRKQFNFI